MRLPRLGVAVGRPDLTFCWMDRAPGELPDPAIRRVIPTPDGQQFEVAVGGDEKLFRYEICGLGTFAIQAEQASISFFASDSADPMLVEHALVNSVLAIYAGFRSVVCLHAATVSTGGRALVLAGPSGNGKSTQAWRLIERGWDLISDDATVLRRNDDGRWTAYAGSRTIRIKDLFRDDAWLIRGKMESFAPRTATQAVVRRITLLDRSAPAGRVQPAGSILHRSLMGVQPGWHWAGSKLRRKLADLTWALLDENSVRTQVKGLRSHPVRAGVGETQDRRKR